MNQPGLDDRMLTEADADPLQHPAAGTRSRTSPSACASAFVARFAVVP